MISFTLLDQMIPMNKEKSGNQRNPNQLQREAAPVAQPRRYNFNVIYRSLYTLYKTVVPGSFLVAVYETRPR